MKVQHTQKNSFPRSSFLKLMLAYYLTSVSMILNLYIFSASCTESWASPQLCLWTGTQTCVHPVLNALLRDILSFPAQLTKGAAKANAYLGTPNMLCKSLSLKTSEESRKKDTSKLE